MGAEAMRLRRAGAAPVDAVPAAFERLFTAEYARVVRIAQRVLGDPGEAEDVAQDAFVSLYRSHPADAPYAAAWLHAAAAHSALNAVRGRRRRAAREQADHAERADRAGGDPESEAIATEEREIVREALGRIPAKSAALLVLRYSGLRYAECAAALGTETNQIGTLLRRAEDALRKEVTRDG